MLGNMYERADDDIVIYRYGVTHTGDLPKETLHWILVRSWTTKSDTKARYRSKYDTYTEGRRARLGTEDPGWNALKGLGWDIA